MEFDFDLFVIGAGSGGVRAARVSAQYGARVAIAEESRYGGTCVIRGCIPKKLFVYASEFAHLFEDASAYGWDVDEPRADWKRLRDNKDKEIERLSQIYLANLHRHGVETVNGRAKLVDRHTIEVGDKRFRAKTILIATGSRPWIPDVPGAEHAVTSDEMFHLDALPEHATVIGGGYIGVEFAGILRGLGCRVDLVHRRDLVLRGFDEDIRRSVTDGLRAIGVNLRLPEEVNNTRRLDGSRLELDLNSGGSMETNLVLCAMGRRPYTSDLGLESAGVELASSGAIVVDDSSRSSVDNIYAVGDCTDRVNLTPVAIREGQAFADTVFGEKPWQVDYDTIPSAVFSQPPAATVGITEAETRERGIDYDVYQSSFRPLFHTLTGREERVMVKMLVARDDERILGLHVVGKDAAEIVQSAAIAVKMGATKSDFDRTCALHPSTAEELVLLREKRDS